MRKHETLK